MSAFGMHPTFNTLETYKAWRSQWRSLYKLHSLKTKKNKRKLKAAARAGEIEEAAKLQRQLREQRVMASKMMTLLQDAKLRWQRILTMQRDLEAQMASFPLTIEAPSIDFHFNKGSIEFPFLPAWTLRCKGKSYYVHHVDFDVVGTTRETPEHASTKGSIRFRQAVLTLSPDGTASIRRRQLAAMQEAA